MKKELIEVPRTTLDIYNYQQDGVNVYEFNATECSPPEPMVNTIVCLALLKNENDMLQVTFFHEPTPLYERTSQNFSHASQELENGDVLVTFIKKQL